MTGAPSGPLKLATDFIADAPPVDDPDLVDLAHKWLVHRGLPIAARITPALHGLWTDGFLVGSISARTVLAHHLVKAESTVTMAADWAHWSPGDEEAARELLGAEGFGDGLQALLDAGNVVIKGIEATKLDQLAAILATGVQHGDAPATIGQAIRALVDDPKWAYKVALTETTRAVSSATLLRYSRNGVTGKEWMTAGDQHVCTNICGPNEDQGAILVDQAFQSADEAPPGHPLCRCSIGPAWLTAEEAAAAGAPMLPGFNPGDRPLAARRAAPGSDTPAQISAAHALEIRQALTAARTIPDIEKAFSAEAKVITGRDDLAGLRVNFGRSMERESSPLTAREHAEGILRVLERFPDAHLQRIAWFNDAEQSVFATAEGGKIEFNLAYAGSAERGKYLRQLAKGVEDWDKHGTSWSFRGSGNPAATAVHEMGHILDIETLGMRAAPKIEALVRDLADREGTTPYMLIRQQVSQYATTNTIELTAEAFGDAIVNGSAASELSRGIFDLIVREYEATNGTYFSAADLAGEPGIGAHALKLGADPLGKLKVTELRALAKDRGLTGYSKLTKPQLLERLRAAEPAGVERAPAAFEARLADAAKGTDALDAAGSHLSRPGAGARETLTTREPTGWTPAQTKEHLDALAAYQNSPVSINTWLRSDRAGPAPYYLRAMDEVQAHSRLAKEIQAWRGMQSGVEVFGDRLAGDLTGATWTEQAFASVSVREPAARMYAMQGVGSDLPGMVLRLVVPEDVSAIDLGKQGELLLDRGLSMRVAADRGVVDGVRLLDVEIIPKTADLFPAAGETMTEAQAVARQAALDEVRGRADIAAEIHELVNNGASERALLARITSREKLTGLRVPDLKALVNDPGALLRAVDDMADRAGLTRIGDMTGGPVPFDRKLMEGEKGLTSGQQVVVTKPGYTATLANGETVQVARAQVSAATQDEIRAAAERVAAEQKATERAIARAAARERNQLLEARTKVGDLLAELDELVDKKAATKVFEERLTYAEQTGAVDKATATVLRKAVATEDPTKVRAALTRVASKNGLKPIGQAGKTAKYDPALHEPVGAVPAEGTTVRVVRRGMSTTVDGQDIQLTRARTTVPEAKPKPAPKPRAKPAPKPSTAPQTSVVDYDARRAAIRDLSAQTPTATRPLGGGYSAYTNLLDYPDRRIVEKTYGARTGEVQAEAVREADREELGPQVLEALGLRAPAVARWGDNRLAMEFIDGQTGSEIVPWGKQVPAAIIDSDDGRLMGLADRLMANTDRNEGNWIRTPDGHLAGIDHGSIFQRASGSGTSPFSEYLTAASNDFTKADMALVRARLESLAAEFARLNRTAWHDSMMRRLTQIEKRAKGTHNRIAP